MLPEGLGCGFAEALRLGVHRVLVLATVLSVSLEVRLHSAREFTYYKGLAGWRDGN